MASSVGPHGVVVGSDSDGAILALARQDAEQHNWTTSSFVKQMP
jgi:ubiquinone/menaquinone biosynthesis C-methylase UbiE